MSTWSSLGIGQQISLPENVQMVCKYVAGMQFIIHAVYGYSLSILANEIKFLLLLILFQRKAKILEMILPHGFASFLGQHMG